MKTTPTKKKKATKKQKILAIVGLVGVAVALVLFLVFGIPAIKDNKNSAYNSRYKYDGVSLVGTWQEKENFTDSFYKIYEFRTDGKAITSLYVYGIEAVRDELSTYRIEDQNTLVITYTVDGVIQSDRTKFSISEDGKTLVLRQNGRNTVLKAYDLDYNKDTAIFGEWTNTENPEMKYTFADDYTGTASDESASNKTVFSTKNGTLYLFIDENIIVPDADYGLSEKYIIPYEYEVENDTLTLKGTDGKTVTYQRSK